MNTLNKDIDDQNQRKVYRVLGIGTPIIDYLLNVSDEYLESIHAIRGGSILIDFATLQSILKDYPPTTQQMVTGGSSANTIKGLTKLGYQCAFSGKTGRDSSAKQFTERMQAYGVIPHLSSNELPTAQVACLITPDRDRTMRAFLGAGADMNADDLSMEIFERVKLVHIEGYLMTRPGLVERAMALAHAAGAKISFDLSSFEIAGHYKQPLAELLAKYVDIVFGNEEEAHALTGLPPDKACEALNVLCKVAIVKMGYKGSLAVAGGKPIFQKAYEVKVVDTTGAGDLFASGFLHGYLKNKSLKENLRYGTLVASEVIQASGAEIPEARWLEIKKQFARGGVSSL